ncbi:Pectin lyase-like superfamily protein [Hibiscus syriacus]|uniref:Pectin lyase-like superfamily protein n=1 Tax=Hibiscus syriacus TaxID=106335 RepID=A0A6A3AL42_HIBSY|nr:Pectin lyase-like superfamily protein [Hibiscus syriacus]
MLTREKELLHEALKGHPNIDRSAFCHLHRRCRLFMAAASNHLSFLHPPMYITAHAANFRSFPNHHHHLSDGFGSNGADRFSNNAGFYGENSNCYYHHHEDDEEQSCFNWQRSVRCNGDFSTQQLALAEDDNQGVGRADHKEKDQKLDLSLHL